MRPHLTRREALLLAALVGIIILLALPVLSYPLGRDQGEFATIGRGLLDGRVPYVDLWNPKPPAVFYTYSLAMAVFGRTTEALRAIDLLIIPVICVALYWLGTRIATRRAGLFALVIFATFYFTETFWTLTQNDGIALLPMVLAPVCAFKAADNAAHRWRGRLWAFAFGALAALVLWFKYPFVLIIAAFIIGALLLPGVITPGSPLRRAWLPLGLSFAAGGLLVGGGGLLVMAALGALPALIESARVTTGYTLLTFNADEFFGLLSTSLGFRWSHWGLLFVLTALWLVIWGRRLLQQRSMNPPVPAAAPTALESEPQPDDGAADGQRSLPLALRTVVVAVLVRPNGFVWLWLLSAIFVLVLQAKFYDYHWLPLLPPLALLAGAALDRALRAGAHFVSTRIYDEPGTARLAHREALLLDDVASTLVVLGLLSMMAATTLGRSLPYLLGQQPQVEYYATFQGGEFVADESLLVADYLRERTTPGDSLYIWGFRPEIYYLTGLNPATRFIFQFPLVAEWYPPEWRQENVDVLWAALPPYVLVVQADYMPWVTGSHDDSNTLLQRYTELNNWLIFNYERDTQIGNIFIWRRKSG